MYNIYSKEVINIKPSEQFKDMDEVRQYAESLKHVLSPQDYELVLFLFGLLENEGLSTPILINGENVMIDTSISSIIKAWNDRGIKTLACCSGLAVEHKESKFFAGSGGYVSFSYSDALYTKINDICGNMFEVEKVEAYLQPAICVRVKGDTDSELLKLWCYLSNSL